MAEVARGGAYPVGPWQAEVAKRVDIYAAALFHDFMLSEGQALLREARRSFPFLERIIGDAGYQGQKMQAAVARTGTWELQIVRRCDRHRCTLAWISRCHRLARDYERHARKAAAFVRLAMIRLMLPWGGWAARR